MLMVIPRSFSTESNNTYNHEDHLLERITVLEYALTRLEDRFERLLQVMHKQATNNFSNHAMIEALIGLLDEANLIDKETLVNAWQSQLVEQAKQQHIYQVLLERQEKILSATTGEPNKLFTQLVEDGIELLTNEEVRRGVKLLEKAAALEPTNTELNFFLGEHFYHQEKIVLAQHYLQRVLAASPQHYPAVLLLGIICSDKGENENAKRYLSTALSIKESFVAHYSLGRILASVGELEQALPHFKRALLLKPTPDLYYVVGHAYLERGHAQSALKHLHKAVELDPQFDAALYHLGLIYLKQNLVDKAREHFRAAYQIKPLARYRSALRARAGARLPALPVFGNIRVARRRILTSADTRLANLLRSELAKQQMG
jgi:tetratricopeptide (TPR) repeat protein